MLEAQGSLYTELYFCTALCCVADPGDSARSKRRHAVPSSCALRCMERDERDWHEDEDRRFLFNITKGRLPGRTRASRGPAPRSICGPCGGTTRTKTLYRPCVLRRESQCGEKKKRNIREGSSGAPGRACGASPGVSDQAVESGGAIFGSSASDRAVHAAVCAGVQKKSSCCLVCAGVHIVGRVNCARAARTRQHAAAQDGGLLQVGRPR